MNSRILKRGRDKIFEVFLLATLFSLNHLIGRETLAAVFPQRRSLRRCLYGVMIVVDDAFFIVQQEKGKCSRERCRSFRVGQTSSAESS